LSLCLFSGSIAATIGPIANLPIVNRNIAPDGFSRSAVLADGTFPGPLIKGYKGNRFLLNVEDKLTDDTMLRSTSIHWHGFLQKDTSWADGPSFSNKMIAANHSFLYDPQVPEQAGTYWYHSHLSTQYCDGLRGPMVAVYDLLDPHRFLKTQLRLESTVITLADWYHYPASSSVMICLADDTDEMDQPDSPLAVISVIKGKRYRFRLVAISCDPNYNFSIDGHSLTIIEVDGKPLTVDSLQIFGNDARLV
ncbi:Cupredoxin, partial [Mycena polygramma]